MGSLVTPTATGRAAGAMEGTSAELGQRVVPEEIHLRHGDHVLAGTLYRPAGPMKKQPNSWCVSAADFALGDEAASYAE
jgi:hypothetical protein